MASPGISGARPGSPSGEYFMFLAHDDKLAPEFLEKCVAVLDSHPEVALCYPKAIEIDSQGNHLYKKEQFLDADSPQPHKRFRQMIRMDHNCETLFGLTRASAFKQTTIHAEFPDGDRVMLAELSLHGTYYRVPEYLFLHREHPVQVDQPLPHPLRPDACCSSRSGRVNLLCRTFSSSSNICTASAARL